MAFCQNCGTKLPEGAFFCGNCGASVHVDPSVFAPQNQTPYNQQPRSSYPNQGQPTYSQQNPSYYPNQNRTTTPQQSQSAYNPQSQNPYRPANPSSYAAPNNPAPRATNWTGTSAPIPYNTTGLWIWSVFCLLMLLIPGVIAISNTAQINKCDTAEQQEKHIKAARIACIIGTVLGALIIIGRLAQGA